MLLKWTPGVGFTNILRTAFKCADPKSTKMTDGLTVFLALLGSVHVKDVCERKHFAAIDT